MSQSIDIKGLQEIIGGDPIQYHEIVRNEKAINCAARWPLLAQIQNGEITTPVVAKLPRETGASPRNRADVVGRPFMTTPTPAPTAINGERIFVAVDPFALRTQANVTPNRTPVPVPVPPPVPMPPLVQKVFAPVPAPARWLASAATPLPVRASVSVPASTPALKVPPAQGSGLAALFKRLEFANETDNGSAR